LKNSSAYRVVDTLAGVYCGHITTNHTSKEHTMSTPTYAYDAEPGAKPEEFTCAVIEGYSKDPECEHPDVDSQGVCLDCEQPVEGWEPNDAQIFAHYGQSKEIAA